MDLRLRKATSADRDWLYDLHRSALGPYVEQIWGWDEAWQTRHFDEHFVPDRIQIALLGSEAVGMLQWEERGAVIYIRQIAVLPEHQNRGVGRAILERLCSRSAEEEKDVSLQVFKINERARRLYERLGFVVDGESETHYSMRWSQGSLAFQA